ncbi:MAG: hypothetical protein SGARI_002286 [Bacillariaceae sp.]
MDSDSDAGSSVSGSSETSNSSMQSAEAHQAWEDEIIDRYEVEDDMSVFKLKYAEEGIGDAQPYTDWTIIVACPEKKRIFHQDVKLC